MKNRSQIKLLTLFVSIVLFSLISAVYYKSIISKEKVISTEMLDNIKGNQPPYYNFDFYRFMQRYENLALDEVNKGLTANQIENKKTFYYLISKDGLQLTGTQQYLITKYCYYNLKTRFELWPDNGISDAIDLCSQTRSKFLNDYQFEEEDRAFFFKYDFFVITFIYLCFILITTRSFKKSFLFIPFIILGDYSLLFRWGILLPFIGYTAGLLVMVIFPMFFANVTSIYTCQKQLQPMSISKIIIFSILYACMSSIPYFISAGYSGGLNGFFDSLFFIKLFPIISAMVLSIIHLMSFQGIFEVENGIIIKKLFTQSFFSKGEIKSLEVKHGLATVTYNNGKKDDVINSVYTEDFSYTP